MKYSLTASEKIRLRDFHLRWDWGTFAIKVAVHFVFEKDGIQTCRSKSGREASQERGSYALRFQRMVSRVQMIPQLNIWGREMSLGVRGQLWRVDWGSTFSGRILLPSTICTEQASSGDGIILSAKCWIAVNDSNSSRGHLVNYGCNRAGSFSLAEAFRE